MSFQLLCHVVPSDVSSDSKKCFPALGLSAFSVRLKSIQSTSAAACQTSVASFIHFGSISKNPEPPADQRLYRTEHLGRRFYTNTRHVRYYVCRVCGEAGPGLDPTPLLLRFTITIFENKKKIENSHPLSLVIRFDISCSVVFGYVCFDFYHYYLLVA